MKSYTDIEQSRKLAEILPLKSADMYYILMPDGVYNHFPLIGMKTELAENTDIPCWSLTALLSLIRETIGYTLYGVNNVYMSCDLGDKPWKLETEVYDNEVDACYELILKLKEENLL